MRRPGIWRFLRTDWKPVRRCIPLLSSKAVESALTPAMVKEVVYQAVDYLGFGRAFPFFEATNDVFESLKIPNPEESRATTTMEDRLRKEPVLRRRFRAADAGSLESGTYQPLACI